MHNRLPYSRQQSLIPGWSSPVHFRFGPLFPDPGSRDEPLARSMQRCTTRRTSADAESREPPDSTSVYCSKRSHVKRLSRHIKAHYSRKLLLNDTETGTDTGIAQHNVHHFWSAQISHWSSDRSYHQLGTHSNTIRHLVPVLRLVARLPVRLRLPERLPD